MQVETLSGKELTNPPEVSFELLLVTAQFRAGDIYSVKTALSVAGNYRPQITGHLVAAFLLLVLYFLL